MIFVNLSSGPKHYGAHDDGILSGNLRQTGVSASPISYGLSIMLTGSD
jgi:hypothetical protein